VEDKFITSNTEKRTYSVSTGTISDQVSYLGQVQSADRQKYATIYSSGSTNFEVYMGYIRSDRMRKIYEEDPEILAMSDKEIVSEARAAFGMWADRDDITDTWLDELRGGWENRLDDIYGPNETNSI
jgi:hypothetical protein